MRKIKYIGLDMDHTLIRYNTRAFESLVYDQLVKLLVETKGYPSSIQKLKFIFENAIRGLVLDCKNGNVLKLSRYGAIRRSFHGTKEIDFQKQNQLYRSKYIDLGDPNYLAIDTAFSIAFCVLFAQIIDLKDENPYVFPSYTEITKDILSCLDRCHKDGSIKSVVGKNLDHYVIKDPKVVEGLKKYRRHGKKIFIATNSEFYYTKLLLDYAINPYLDNGETWEDFFEFVITLADKPRFFYDNLRMLKIDPKSGNMTNLNGPIEKGVYQGGVATKITNDLNISGEDILYIGDHIYGDILRLKKDCNWRTALVVEEMSEEMQSNSSSAPFDMKIQELMAKKEPLDQVYVDLTTKKFDSKSSDNDAEIKKVQEQIAEIDAQISSYIVKKQKCYNECWGPIFRTGAEESYFAQQVDRYACIYMAKLSDLLDYSPRSYFRAVKRPLAHEII